MEASKALDLSDYGEDPEFRDWFEREVDSGLPEGDDRASVRLRCDYLLEKIQDQEKRAEEIAQFTARKIQMVQDHSRGELDTIKRRVEWLHSRLRLHLPHTGAGMEEAFGKKSLALPHGTVGFRASPATVRIVDQAALVVYANANGIPVQITTTEKVLSADVKTWHEMTGDVPPGVEYVEGSESFYVKPKADA